MPPYASNNGEWLMGDEEENGESIYYASLSMGDYEHEAMTNVELLSLLTVQVEEDTSKVPLPALKEEGAVAIVKNATKDKKDMTEVKKEPLITDGNSSESEKEINDEVL